jgi:hypothetical protein
MLNVEYRIKGVAGCCALFYPCTRDSKIAVHRTLCRKPQQKSSKSPKKSLEKSLFLGFFSGVEIVTRCKSACASVVQNAFALLLTS